MIMDYHALVGKDFKLVKVVPVVNWHRKMCWVNSDLWCAAFDRGILIYNKDLELKHEIKTEKIKYAECVVADNSGHVLVACSNSHGLHLLEDTGVYVRKIADGNFNYVCVNAANNEVYAVENSLKLVFVLEKVGNAWLQTNVLRKCLTDDLDTVGVHKELLYVCSHKDRQLRLYSLDGSLVRETRQRGKDQLLFPKLCGVDEKGNALLCDWMNHKVHMYRASGDQWHTVNFTSRLDYPVDVCLAQDGIDLYVLQHGVSKNQPNKLSRFTAVVYK